MVEKIDPPIVALQRWERFGGTWRTSSITASGATVELCTCHGESVEELRSSDTALLAYLAERPSSDSDPSATLKPSPLSPPRA